MISSTVILKVPTSSWTTKEASKSQTLVSQRKLMTVSPGLATSPPSSLTHSHTILALLTGNRMNRPSLQGSVFWMAPEVVKQTRHTHKADIWSIGCLVVEMLTGEHPWAQLTQMQAIFQIGSSATPTIPSDISPEAQDFLKQTFKIDHEARPSAVELVQHLWIATLKVV